MNGAQRIHQVLATALAQDKRVQVLGEALQISPASAGLLETRPDQVHLLPAADATLIGVAVGMALGGHRPVVELAGTSAIWGALQQLGQEAAAVKGEFSAPVVVRVPIGPEGFDPTPLLTAVPGLCVACGSTPTDAAALVDAALKHSGPTVLLECRSVLAATGGPDQLPEVALGSARVVRLGSHVSVLAWGDGVAAAEKAANILAGDSIEAEVVDLRSLSPLDAETIGASVQKTGRVVLTGAASGALSTSVQTAFLRLESPPTTAEAQAGRIVEEARGAFQY
jgi:pyruvate/2-oxoglutarate/acetoin dehydrogenase E1 component